MPGTHPGVQFRRAAVLVQPVAHCVGHNVQLRGLSVSRFVLPACCDAGDSLLCWFRCASEIGGAAALPHPRRLRQDAHRDATRASRYGGTNVQLPQT